MISLSFKCHLTAPSTISSVIFPGIGVRQRGLWFPRSFSHSCKLEYHCPPCSQQEPPQTPKGFGRWWRGVLPWHPLVLQCSGMSSFRLHGLVSIELVPHNFTVHRQKVLHSRSSDSGDLAAQSYPHSKDWAKTRTESLPFFSTLRCLWLQLWQMPGRQACWLHQLPTPHTSFYTHWNYYEIQHCEKKIWQTSQLYSCHNHRRSQCRKLLTVM